MTFKTWTANGTAARYHRTAVLNKIADAFGRRGYDLAAAFIGSAEYISGVQANQAVEAAQ
jgi:hypothetical protein